MTNIVFVWRFLLDISVSVTLKNDQRQKAFRGMTFIGTHRVSVKHLFEEANVA